MATISEHICKLCDFYEGARSMKVLSLAAMILVSVACNNAAPTATAYKEQLGAPAAVTGNGNVTTGGGDIEKGKTAFTASCASCHAPGAMSPLDGSEDIKAGFGANAAHTAFKPVFDNDSENISAYLKSVNGGAPAAGEGDAAKGNALLTATCEAVCHGKSAGALDSFSNFEGQETATYHPPDVQTAIKNSKADLIAALKTRT
jgi:mono/diheme cytochrome c family protein